MTGPETDTTYSGLPEIYREGIRLYIEEGILPGSFLTAVLRNDLMESLARCSGPMEDVKTVVRWLYNEAPSTCWGSERSVKEWVALTRRES